jgi:cyclohexanecarboxyl-CoA dehydrogenase
MDFAQTPEQDAIVDTAMRFAQDRLRPGAQAREVTGNIDRKLMKELGSLGLIGMELPEEYGGSGTGTVTAGLVTEALCSADVGYGYVAVNQSLVGQIIASYANAELKQQWLPRMLAGETLGAIALTEPRGGSDAANLVLKARRDGDDYVIDGEKTSISFATQADFAVFFARTGTVEQGAKGISAFLVPYGIKGLTTSAFNDLGGRSVGRGSLFFDGVRIPKSHLLGDENMGFVQVMQGFDFSRALIGLQCLGAARQSLKETWEFIKERKAFGKPLSHFQGVTFPLAESETYMEAARFLCLRTLWLKDQGLPHTSEAAMCKWWGPKLAAEIIQTCLLAHGHSAYSSDLPYEKRLRDVLGLQIGDGTAQIMKLIIARQKAGRAAVP